jgi:hypothetical protein
MMRIGTVRTGTRGSAPGWAGGSRKFLPVLTATALLALACCCAARAEEGCAPAITTAERANGILPAHILRAIGVVESGRRDPVTGQLAAWPWSVNAAGDSRVFDTRDEAIAFVRDAQARGVRSIDVGCMQVNLMYHPNAFASLEEAFTPETNVRYATAFLMDLRQRTGDWTTATGNYHSAAPGLSEDYARRVLAVLNGQPFAPAFPPIRTVPPVWRFSPDAQISAEARRIQIIEPGTTPVHRSILPSAAKLPHVYYP